MEFSRFIGGFDINQIFYKKFQYLNFKKSNKNSGNSAVAIVNKAQLSCKQTNIEKSRIRNKSGIFTIIMFLEFGYCAKRLNKDRRGLFIKVSRQKTKCRLARVKWIWPILSPQNIDRQKNCVKNFVSFVKLVCRNGI